MLRMLSGLFLILFTAEALIAQLPAAPTSVSLHPGDVVKIEVWREVDLSGEFLVDPNGAVTLPLLGQQPVVGIPFGELRDRLLALYQVHLKNPSINITPLRRIYVLGEVNQPGPYAVDPTVSLAGAVAVAGGANPQGDLRRIRVVRDGQVVLDRIPAETALASVDIRSGDQIFVDRRSWFDRNSTFIVSALLSVTSIVITLAR